MNGDRGVAQANETLYCSNLPDKLQKDDLKRALYMLFVTHGPVLDIVALKTPKMRGQAHVLFRDKYASTQAMRALQDYEFFGKPMKISYARTKSDTLAKLDGTFKQPPPNASTASAPLLQLAESTAAPGTGQAAASLPSGPLPSLGAPPGLSAASQPAVPNGTVPPSQGAKRPRDESDDEQQEDDAPMDMDDEAMDESDDD